MATKGIRSIAHDRVLNDIIQTVVKKEGKSDFLIFVVDKHSLKILSAALKVYDITEAQIALIEDIGKKRKPLPNMTAIYFIHPSKTSVDALIADMGDKSPMYKAAYVFFTVRCEQELLLAISQSTIVKRLKGLTVANMHFLALEQQAFSLGLLEDIGYLYAPDKSLHMDKFLRLAAQQLATTCATLNELPYIRYDKSAPLAARFAKLFDEQVMALYRGVPGQKPNMNSSILILERTFDPLSPLIHEFTYQAMINDLLDDVKDGKYSYEFTAKDGATSKRDALLDESDPLWPDLRHKHIADAIKHVVDEFTMFQSTNTDVASVGKLNKGEAQELSQIRDAVKAMPRYNQQVGKYSLHISLTDACMKQFDMRQLLKLATWEQNLAMGVDAGGHEVKKPLENIMPILQDPSVQMHDKQRLLMIYIITREGLQETERKKLLDLAGLNDRERRCIASLAHLGVSMERAKAAKKLSRDQKKRVIEQQERRMVDVPYEISRYTPPVKYLMEAHLRNQLEVSQYPYLRDPPPQDERAAQYQQATVADSVARKWQWSRPADTAAAADAPSATSGGGKLLVFVLGGVTYSEMRSAYEVTKALSKQVYIGGTSVLTPKSFIDQLDKLSSPVSAADVHLDV
eukprot:TRINITY_DN3606_c0_g1_i1.p1 TRINITY_DN3606_c0_g1~~TRINITY_DN3606_c0_g1_i1.p1  ORF type:complete len:637 (+),score=168.93 TRINITY_DN3606_c0_g1_i1:26-1912(+)